MTYFLNPKAGQAGDLLWDKEYNRFFLVMSKTCHDDVKYPHWEYCLLNLNTLQFHYNTFLTSTTCVTWFRIYPLDETPYRDKTVTTFEWRERG